MSEKLLPCPFCNGPADYTGREGQGYRVVCKHCDARGGWGDYGYQAEAAWNRRTPQGMETRQGGDSLPGSVACDDSPVGHQADAPETVAAPIPVEGEVIAWRYEKNGVVALHSCRKPMYLTPGMGHWSETPLYDRLTFSRGVDEVREALEGVEGRVADASRWWHNSQQWHEEDACDIEEGAAGNVWDWIFRDVKVALSTIEEPRG